MNALSDEYIEKMARSYGAIYGYLVKAGLMDSNFLMRADSDEDSTRFEFEPIKAMVPT